jgi:hypothetical protein
VHGAMDQGAKDVKVRRAVHHRHRHAPPWRWRGAECEARLKAALVDVLLAAEADASARPAPAVRAPEPAPEPGHCGPWSFVEYSRCGRANLLGEGAGCEGVYKLADPATGQAYAVKVVDRALEHKADAKHQFRREVEIFSRLRHPGVIQVRRGLCGPDGARRAGAEDPGRAQLAAVVTEPKHHLLVIELCEGGDRARSHCRSVLPLIHCIPDSLTYSVPLFMKRRCDRTLGGPRPAAAAEPGRAAGRRGEHEGSSTS